MIVKCRMAKAEYRRTDRFDALSPATPIGEAGHAAGTPVPRTSARPETADDLRAAIQRLYWQLESLPRREYPLRAHSLEAQIRTLADRHTALTGWISVSPRVAGARLPPAVW